MAPSVRLALRSQDFQVGVSANDGVSRYFVNAGERSPATGLSRWNLDLSLNTFEALFGSGLDLVLDIDWDPTDASRIVSYDLDSLLANTGRTSYQASENLGFSYWNETFDPFALGTYRFTLSAYDGTELRAQTSIDVTVRNGQTVPEPGSLALAGLAAAALAASRRRG